MRLDGTLSTFWHLPDFKTQTWRTSTTHHVFTTPVDPAPRLWGGSHPSIHPPKASDARCQTNWASVESPKKRAAVASTSGVNCSLCVSIGTANCCRIRLFTWQRPAISQSSCLSWRSVTSMTKYGQWTISEDHCQNVWLQKFHLLLSTIWFWIFLNEKMKNEGLKRSCILWHIKMPFILLTPRTSANHRHDLGARHGTQIFASKKKTIAFLLKRCRSMWNKIKHPVYRKFLYTLFLTWHEHRDHLQSSEWRSRALAPLSYWKLPEIPQAAPLRRSVKGRWLWL